MRSTLSPASHQEPKVKHVTVGFTKGWGLWGEHVHTWPVILTRPADRLVLGLRVFKKHYY